MEKSNRKLINIYELITCVTNASDMVSPELSNHHQKVAYLSFIIGAELNLPKFQQKNLMLAGLIHDIGALSYDERLDLVESEPPNAQDHAFTGAKLIEKFEPLRDVADIIRFHHVPWNNGKGSVFNDCKVSVLSHIIHLADRIAVLVDENSEVLGQVNNIIKTIEERNNTIFKPELVDAFKRISVQECLWLNLVNKSLSSIIPDLIVFDTMELDIDEVINLTKIFAEIIDFSSPFTANHTIGVAKTAEKIAELAGFSDTECKKMLIAGYLHDLGKLAVKNEVLEKPDKLDFEEFNIIRSHTYYTYRLLRQIEGFETINLWASYHHEKLNGKGYPFHLSGENIPLGSRIMAVADIFTAITEDRPYRIGMTYNQAVNVLNSMVDDGSICPFVTSLLIKNYELLNEIRMQAQLDAAKELNYLGTTE